MLVQYYAVAKHHNGVLAFSLDSVEYYKLGHAFAEHHRPSFGSRDVLKANNSLKANSSLQKRRRKYVTVHTTLTYIFHAKNTYIFHAKNT
jgi:hypothetical protein